MASLPTTETMVRRIVRAWHASTPTDRARGVGWYDAARAEAARISPDDVSRGAGAIAAMSPRCQWSTTVAWAEAVIGAADAGAVCPEVSTTNNRGAAWLIATGTHPLAALGRVSHTGRVTSGHKIRAFWANIMGDQDAVTVDVWAYRVATGRDVDRIGARDYLAVADAYRRAAARITRAGEPVSPRDLQAAVWVAARGSKPTDAGWHAAIAA